MTRVWFVTGASRGLGLEIARVALARGELVVATARDESAITARLGARDRHLLALRLDVTDEHQISEAVNNAEQQMGRIDVLVNNAGCGLAGAVEEASRSEVNELLAVNVLGLLSVTRAILPMMRRARSGTIVNISSMTGVRAVPGWGLYGASKFAIEGLSEAMRDELAPLGIAVTLIEPGPLDTGFLEDHSLISCARRIADYDQIVRRVRPPPSTAEPLTVADAIVGLVVAGDPPMRVPVGELSTARLQSKLAWMQSDLDRCARAGSERRATLAAFKGARRGQ
jgi:NAD(P)-dependent dehydrogenase (short-subunit alcohol dehydrogenase family)